MLCIFMFELLRIAARPMFAMGGPWSEVVLEPWRINRWYFCRERHSCPLQKYRPNKSCWNSELGRLLFLSKKKAAKGHCRAVPLGFSLVPMLVLQPPVPWCHQRHLSLNKMTVTWHRHSLLALLGWGKAPLQLVRLHSGQKNYASAYMRALLWVFSFHLPQRHS